MYLGWTDPSKHRTPAQKITDAAARYRRKWGREPVVALVNPADACEVEGIEVRVVSHVAPNTFMVGEDETE